MEIYHHIFTDGLDKLLSASIWFPHWGDARAFLYYEKNKLKGYISDHGKHLLESDGKRILTDQKAVASIISQSHEITHQVNLLYKKNSIVDFARAVHLLADGYEQYFFTEEYATALLVTKKDKKSMALIGKYRLEFLKTNIKVTNIVYKLADRMGRVYGYSPHDTLFLTWQEILNLKNHTVSAGDIAGRKKALKKPVILVCHEEILGAIATIMQIPWEKPSYGEAWCFRSTVFSLSAKRQRC